MNDVSGEIYLVVSSLWFAKL